MANTQRDGKAIETKYKGYRFRSRLEARWAVFFDALGIQWEYEPEGFDLDGDYYLPDFRLHKPDIWVEIKGREMPPQDYQKLNGLVCAQPLPVLCLIGQPWRGEYRGFILCLSIAHETLDGDISFKIESDQLLQNYKEVAFLDTYPITETARCRRCDKLSWIYETPNTYAYGPLGECCGTDKAPIPDDSVLTLAYNAARSARFEHGESPDR